MPFIERDDERLTSGRVVNPGDSAKEVFLQQIKFRLGCADIYLRLAEETGIYSMTIIGRFVDEGRGEVYGGQYGYFIGSLKDLITKYDGSLVRAALTPSCILRNGRIGRRAIRDNIGSLMDNRAS